MYPEKSPLTLPAPGLRKTDLVVFGHKLEQIVLETIPTSKKVSLVARRDLKSIECDLSSNSKRRALDRAYNKNLPVWLKPDKLLLPLLSADDSNLAILVEGIDDLLIESGSDEWLKETHFEISEQFIAARNTFLDPVTTLCNSNSLKEYIAGIRLDEDVHLLLIESLPPARSVKDAFYHTVDTGRLLEEFNRYSFPLFHLGQSVFCCVISRQDKDFVKSLCHSLTNFARNAGLRRIHIGFSSYSVERHQKVPSERQAQSILDEAWIGLQRADRRGPYSFCDYQLLVNPELFPLKGINRKTISKLAYRWKDAKKFSLAYLKPDFHDRKSFDAIMSKHLAKENVVADENGYFILRPRRDESATKKWVLSLIKKVAGEEGDRYSLSAGISAYPFGEYKKTEIARNCMKALLHGSFFGPGSTVVFDSLSLNVSGDAYFGESDLSGAVREYRKGLEIAPDDVNLLNSLGVAYALMNMTGKAFEAFNQVLDRDPDNFMALFNKGLGEKKLKEYGEAVTSFTRAMDVFNPRDEEEAGIIGELQFQLGVCQFRTRNYQECIDVLKKWYRSQKETRGVERCYRYIGISYFHLEKVKQSATWLQRALVNNQSDSEALSLLGTVYLKTGEGDDIAIKFCERSVEQEPLNFEYKIRYARVLSASNRLDEALEILASCTRSKSFRAAAWLETARVHILRDDLVAGARYLQKIFNSKHVSKDLLDQAKELQKSISEKAT